MPDTFIEKAMRQFRIAADAESEIRRESLDDWNFRVGNQWPKDIESQRQIDGRPCLTMNRIPQFIRQVTNEERQRRGAIQIDPIGDGSDPDTAEIFQGIIRHIEVLSDAEIPYDESFEQMVTGGFGYFEVTTEEVDPESRQQEILIKRIKNPFMVYIDPAAQEPDYSDAMFMFKVIDMTVEKYRSLYGKSKMASFSERQLQSIGDQSPEWASKDNIRVAEYWHAEGNGKDRKCEFSVINAVEELSQTDWPSKYFGIIPVMGDDVDVNGKRYVFGLVRFAKDPQRQYNYWVSAATETIALAPKAPFIIAEGQIEGRELEWAQLNRRNVAAQQYKPISISGAQVPPPQRQNAEPAIQGMNQMLAQADRDIKSTTGIYDASLGERGPEESAKAILARQKQSNIATLNFGDNMARSRRHAGRLILDLIPKIYDISRVQRIIHPDGSASHVGIINSASGGKEQDLQEQMQKQQITKIYDIGVGKYDVAVSEGQSYESRRQEAVASITALVNSQPELMNVVGDLLVGNMDWPNAKQCAARMKKMLPPQLQDDDSDPQTQVAKLQSQLQQMGQQHQQLTAALSQANDVIKTKQVETQGRTHVEQMKIEGHMAIEKMKIEAEIAVAEITTKAQMLQEREGFVNDLYGQLHGDAHDVAKQAHQQQHEKEMAAMQGQQDAESQGSDQMHEQDMGQQQDMAAQQSQAAQQQHEQSLAEQSSQEPQKENQ